MSGDVPIIGPGSGDLGSRAQPAWIVVGSTVALLSANPARRVAAAESPPPCIAINFPFHRPEVASTATYLNWLSELGASAMRQMTYNDVHWNQVEPPDGAFSYAKPDQVFSNTHGIYPLPTLYGILAGPRDVYGLQVPWRACTNPPYPHPVAGAPSAMRRTLRTT